MTTYYECSQPNIIQMTGDPKLYGTQMKFVPKESGMVPLTLSMSIESMKLLRLGDICKDAKSPLKGGLYANDGKLIVKALYETFGLGTLADDDVPNLAFCMNTAKSYEEKLLLSSKTKINEKEFEDLRRGNTDFTNIYVDCGPVFETNPAYFVMNIAGLLDPHTFTYAKYINNPTHITNDILTTIGLSTKPTDEILFNSTPIGAGLKLLDVVKSNPAAFDSNVGFSTYNILGTTLTDDPGIFSKFASASNSKKNKLLSTQSVMNISIINILLSKEMGDTGQVLFMNARLNKHSDEILNSVLLTCDLGTLISSFELNVPVIARIGPNRFYYSPGQMCHTQISANLSMKKVYNKIRPDIMKNIDLLNGLPTYTDDMSFYDWYDKTFQKTKNKTYYDIRNSTYLRVMSGLTYLKVCLSLLLNAFDHLWTKIEKQIKLLPPKTLPAIPSSDLYTLSKELETQYKSALNAFHCLAIYTSSTHIILRPYSGGSIFPNVQSVYEKKKYFLI